MKNTLSKLKIVGIFTAVLSIILFIWFSSICGMLGTFNWHIGYRSIYIVLCIILAIHIISLVLNFFLRFKAVNVLLMVFSILDTIIWLAWFVSLKALTSIPVDNSGLNIISQSEEIPSKVKKPGDPLLHVAFASDPHWGSSKSNPEARVKILKAIDSQDFDAFYILGDIAEMGMLAGDFRLAVSDLREYLPNTQFRTIPGNHDVILNGIELYDSIFMKKGEKHYFRMDNGSVHFLFVNMLWDSTELTRKERKWLENQLKEIPQEDTVIVFSHCYAVSSGYYDAAAGKNWGDLKDVMKKFCPILEKYNVDLHMSGHDHFFEYLEKDNVPYLVLGAMGGALDENLIYESPYSKWVNNTDFGYVDMKIYDSHLEFDLVSQNGEKLFSKSIKTK